MLEVIQNLLVRESPVKWLFTGDSITAGALHTFGWRDYVELFTERVRFELSRSRDVVIKTAVNGWTIGRIWDDLDRNVLQFQPDCVSVMVGLNDCKAGAAGVYDFREIYLRTVDRIRDETGAAVVLHTPNWLLATDLSERLLYLPAYAEAVRVICRTAVPVLIILRTGRRRRRAVQCTLGLGMDVTQMNTGTAFSHSLYFDCSEFGMLTA